MFKNDKYSSPLITTKFSSPLEKSPQDFGVSQRSLLAFDFSSNMSLNTFHLWAFSPWIAIRNRKTMAGFVFLRYLQSAAMLANTKDAIPSRMATYIFASIWIVFSFVGRFSILYFYFSWPDCLIGACSSCPLSNLFIYVLHCKSSLQPSMPFCMLELENHQ